MKIKITLACLFISIYSFGQPSVPFTNCPTEQIIVYKDGTNCTEAPYNFYTIDLAGTIKATIGSPTASGVEINAISISNIDKFVYALRYDRTGTSSPCTYANTHLIRMDAAGVIADLGTITPPAGGSITNALGAISNDGKYIFLATVGANTYVGAVTSVESLLEGGTINANYYPITNNCPGKSIADWAVNPVDGNLYGYATYPENVLGTNYMRGSLMKIDLNTYTYTCLGAVNTTEFLDPVRDNFGGVMFAMDNFMYGLNINTRKFYKIDVTTGDVSYISTFPGSGNMRADLGSCASASIVLPVKLSSFTAAAASCLNTLKWKLEDPADVQSQTIMKSTDGKNFTEFFTINNNSTEIFIDDKSNAVNTYYKLKLIERNGGINFSDIKLAYNKCNQTNTLKIIGNPVKNELVALYETNNNKPTAIEILDASGKRILQNGSLLTYSFGKINANIENLLNGIYFLKVTESNGKIVVERFIKN
jgi:Secretion system C-terminal sorting domain